MCVFKNHAFIYFLRPPSWSGTTPLADSLLSPFFAPFTYLETLLAVTGSIHLGLRLLVNWPPLSQPFPTPSPLQIPSTQVKYVPHYDDFKNPASLVRNSTSMTQGSPFLIMYLSYSVAAPHCALLTWFSVTIIPLFAFLLTDNSKILVKNICTTYVFSRNVFGTYFLLETHRLLKSVLHALLLM
jgi:hypothetical protein